VMHVLFHERAVLRADLLGSALMTKTAKSGT
jgi:hypothetical protein